MMPRILAIVVTYNAMMWIDRCVDSLLKSGQKVDILIVDNGSTDSTAEFIKDNYPYLKLVELPGNPGFGAANNVGLKKAVEEGYDYVYLLNQDAWIQEDTIGSLVSKMTSGFGILSPMQYSAKKKLDRNFKKKCGRYIRNAERGYDGVVEVPFVMAAHWLMSVAAIRTVGGFSPAFRQYGEDDNYIHRLKYFGFKCGVVPSAKAVHDRAGRKLKKDAKMHLKYVSAVVKISDPNRKIFWRYFLEPLELACMSAVHFSLIPVKYIPILVKHYGVLTRIRRKSKLPGAFLECKGETVETNS